MHNVWVETNQEMYIFCKEIMVRFYLNTVNNVFYILTACVI